MGDLVILARDHLYGQHLTKAGLDTTLMVADSPVNVDWDFAAGQLNVVAEKDTRLRLKLANVAAVSVDGKTEKLVTGEDGFTHLSLAAGRHVIENAKPSEPVLNQMGERLAALLKDAKAQRERLTAAPVVPTTLNASPLTTAWTANVGGGIVDLVAMSEPRPSGSGIIFAAEGKTVHVLTPDGKEIRKLQTDGNVRCLRWWQEHNLLLVGCADEKVIAFDSGGNRKWVFVSEMDPAVFRAAKDYWFKTAPGHEGIHGLHTGVFLDGKSQAFVGSACTLEILDENGKLVKRLPVFWGPGMKFNLVDAPDGSINLLIARWHNDGHALAIINNRTLDPTSRGFAGVPSGHSNIGGWDCMNRKHIFYEDVDGDGKKEVVSEINGFWNRVTVWTADGTPLYNAQFGPGQNTAPGANVRDLDIADLDGDGRKEILTATFNGLVVALSHRCEKIWAKRLPSPPSVLKVAQSQIFVGCEDGTVVVLNGKGEVICTGKVSGRPTHVEAMSTDSGTLMLLGTDKGELKAMTADRR
jgi:outer membrane protein assembly factor BamB